MRSLQRNQDLSLLNEIISLSEQNLFISKDDGAYACDDEPIPLNCSANLSLSLEPLAIWMEPPVCDYKVAQSDSFKSTFPFASSDLSLVGALIQSCSSDMRAEVVFGEENSLKLSTTIPRSRAGFQDVFLHCGPNEHDVVCSRGKAFYNLPGNVRFRQAIRAYYPLYLAASSKMDKSAIIDRVIDTTLAVNVDEPVRFLKYHSRIHAWSVMGHDQVRDKVGHALREAAYEMERENKFQNIRFPKKNLTRW